MTEQSRVALVTGAGHGIGRAVALHLAKAGYGIALHYGNSRSEAEAVAAEVTRLGRSVTLLQADVGRVADIEALFTEFDRAFERLDVLVNNAGTVQPSPLATLSEEAFDRVFAVNVKGAAFMAREAAKRLGAGGRIVNVSSSRVHFPAAGTTCYAGSKAAVEMFTSLWAVELAPQGVTVNAVAPGPTSPGMIDRAPDFLRAAAIDASPFGRLGTAEEIANVVGFLCGEGAAWITGQVILVNGGGTL